LSGKDTAKLIYLIQVEVALIRTTNLEQLENLLLIGDVSLDTQSLIYGLERVRGHTLTPFSILSLHLEAHTIETLWINVILANDVEHSLEQLLFRHHYWLFLL